MNPVVDVHVEGGTEGRLAEDVLDGLTRPFKEIPPKHFYDSRGSALFERICELPEYYPTRTETAILAERAQEIAAAAGRPDELVELGSGSTLKARMLLDAMAPRRYVPVDVSERMVREAAAELVGEYPGLVVHGVVGDFERHLGEVPAIIEAAYDDPSGVTAEFNRNVLHVINRELGADFDPDGFEHVAFYDPVHEWVELRLRASEACTVRVRDLGLTVEFAAGEEMRTEISAKFTPERVRADCAAAGMELERTWTDPERLFGLSLARAV